jgi:hypothetical protein
MPLVANAQFFVTESFGKGIILPQTVEEEDKEKSELKQKIANLNSDNEDLQNILTDLEAKILKLEEKDKENGVIIDSLKSIIFQLKEENEKKDKNYAILFSEYQKLVDTLVLKEKKITYQEFRIKELRKEIERITVANLDLQRQLASTAPDFIRGDISKYQNINNAYVLDFFINTLNLDKYFKHIKKDYPHARIVAKVDKIIIGDSGKGVKASSITDGSVNYCTVTPNKSFSGKIHFKTDKNILNKSKSFYPIIIFYLEYGHSDPIQLGVIDNVIVKKE